MNRKIPNRPHPTPDPEKTHGVGKPDRGGLARSLQGFSAASEHVVNQRSEAETDEPTYDSCFDDLNQVLSQSMRQPDPDPNLESAGQRTGEGEVSDPENGPALNRKGKAPRTSEIFRSVVVPGGDRPAEPASSSIPAEVPAEARGEVVFPELEVAERHAEDAGAGEPLNVGGIPWGQIVLLSYASVLTLALSWLLWTGRIPRAAAPEAAPIEKPAAESAHRPAPPASDAPPPPLPPENLTTLGKPIRLGDLQVTPLSVEARPVELVRTIDSNDHRREDDCLVLRLRLANLSRDLPLSPLDRNLVRDRDTRAFDPYIATSEGRSIRLFPLAMDSEWSILGQEFPVLQPGESAETSVVAEPGSAAHVAAEMTWRVRIRIGVYRSDMLGVKFTRTDVRFRPAATWEEGP